MLSLDIIAFLPILIFEKVVNYEDYKSHNYYKYLDHIGRKIIEKVDSSQNITYFPKENIPGCKSGNKEIYFGYVSPNVTSYDFVICTYNIYSYFGERRFKYQINSTVRHEAAHSAQLCKGGDNLLGVDQSKFKGYPEERVFGPYSIYKKLPYRVKLMELEAFALESQPEFVLRNVEYFCF